MRVFFDSSAIAKRYVDEAGTADVLAWCDRATELALSVIAVPELIKREGSAADLLVHGEGTERGAGVGALAVGYLAGRLVR